MGHSLGDGIIVVAISALLFGHLYLKYRLRMSRLELIHKERLEAIEKGIPLPELPLEPEHTYAPPNPHILPILGIILIAFGAGTMIALSRSLEGEIQRYWIMPLPLTFMGFGLMLYYFFTTRRERE